MMGAYNDLSTGELIMAFQPASPPLLVKPDADGQTRLKQQIQHALSFLDREHIIDLLSPYTDLIKPRIEIHLDYENLHISLRRMGWTPQPEILIKAIRNAVSDLGLITSIKAYADWALLERSSGYDIQRALRVNKVEPHYTLKGKNSADIVMINSLRDTLEKELLTQSKIETFVIGTGDGHFLPVLETIKARGKRVIVLACKNSLSQSLKQEASEVVYLTDYLNLAQLRRRHHKIAMDKILAKAG